MVLRARLRGPSPSTGCSRGPGAAPPPRAAPCRPWAASAPPPRPMPSPGRRTPRHRCASGTRGARRLPEHVRQETAGLEDFHGERSERHVLEGINVRPASHVRSPAVRPRGVPAPRLLLPPAVITGHAREDLPLRRQKEPRAGTIRVAPIAYPPKTKRRCRGPTGVEAGPACAIRVESVEPS